MEKSKITFSRKLFFTLFITSFIILCLASLITLVLFDFHSSIALRLYGIPKDEYGTFLLMLIGFWKLIVIQFTLIPAISLYIIEKRMD